MNVGNVIGFPTALAPAKRGAATPNTDEVLTTSRPANSAEFATFLTMLIGNNPRLRTDLLKQLPAEGANLLEHLLAETEEGSVDGALTEWSASPTAVPAAIDSANTMATTPAAADVANALNTVRYGMIPDSAERPGKNGIVLPTHPTPAGPSRISPAVLARIASRKTASVEELLAVGDQVGALARTKLDSLLAKAGTDEGLSIAAINSMSAALSAALSTSANDVTTPVRDAEALDPELRARLERVVQRMKNEFGHDVTVVETARSQERQDHLYAQGRTTPGAVVTWTTDSAHTHGAALDVVVDGSWNNPEGFARLQQIAREEGLRTLGPGDPGHLELPKESWTTDAAVRVVAANTSAPVASGIARVATVARVAPVASTASAGVPSAAPQLLQPNDVNASLGILAQSDASAGQSNSNTGSNNAQLSQDAGNQSARRERGNSGGIDERVVENATERSKKSNLRAPTDSNEKSGTQNASPAFGNMAPASNTGFIGPINEIERPSGAGAVQASERIDGINALREQQGSKPLSQITLEVEGPNGGTQQITVDVRGNTVGTHISTDSLSADRMRSNVNELRTGLESRGLESDTVRISTQGARTSDAAEQVKQNSSAERDAMRLGGAASGGATTSDNAAQQGPRDRSSAARDWEEKQAAREERNAQQRGDQSQGQRRGGTSQGAERPQYQEKQ